MNLPTELTELVTNLERDTGVTPTVEAADSAGASRWLLTLRNDRVEMTLLVKRAQRNRYTWLKSTLVVDGQPRPVVSSYKHFVQIFNDPDETPPEREVPAPLPPCSAEGLPPMVAFTYQKLVATLGPESITLGADSKGWVVDVVSANGQAFMRLGFWRRKPRKPVTEMGIQLIVEGRDRSREVKGDLAAAMALIARQSVPNTGPVAGQTGQESTSGEGFGSVGVRRHSVIRN